MIFFDAPYNIDRFSAGTIDDTTGDYTDSASATIEIYANIQPITGKYIDHLPEGRRDKENIYGFCDTKLEIDKVDSSSGEPLPIRADIVNYNDEKYEVYEVVFYENILDEHYEFKASKIL